MFEFLHHIAIIASDYDRTVDFYVNRLGFSVKRETFRPERGDVKLDLVIDGSTELEIFVEKDPPARVTNPEACGLRHIAFRVDDIYEAVRELKEKGIETEPLRADPITGCPMTFFRDPDGLPVEIREGETETK